MRTLSSAIAKVFSPAPVPQAGPAIGRIQYVVGSVTVIRADGTKLQGIVTDDLYAGDALDTGGDGRVGVTFRDGTAFCLSHESRMVLDEYVCSPDGTLSSAQLCVSRGRFAFIASSTGDNLAVDTPFARIRGSANNGAIGVVTVAALTFALMHDLRAAAPDLEFLLDDLLSYKDMQHGTFELVIKGPAPRIVSVDDPEVTFVVNPSETGANVQQVTNTAADMAALLAASQEAHATYLLGLADPFTTGAASGQRALGSGAYDVVQLAINLNARALPSLRTENQNSVGSDFLDRDSPDALVQTTVSSGTADLTVAGDGGETSVSTGLSFVTGTDAITLSFAASQSPVVSGLDETASLTWQRDAGDPSGRTLLGKIGGVTVITLTLTGDVTAAGGGDTARPTVTAVLSGNLPHQNAPDADSLTITGLVVNATDTDGEITTGTVNVTVVDDAPTVEVVAAVADGTPATDSIARGRQSERDVDAERRRRRCVVDQGVGCGRADPGCCAAWRWACGVRPAGWRADGERQRDLELCGEDQPGPDAHAACR